ncbi:MAG TPA: M20 family metallopeptidase [Thermoanaerobaculia bacterium]
MAISAALLSHLRGCQQEMAALLRELALLETPSLVPAAQEAAFRLLAPELEKAGLATRRLRGRRSGGQLYAAPERRARRDRGTQLLIGHCDTVWPLGTLEGMPVEVRDGRLAGPGVFDMKGGLVQGVFALRALRELGLEPPLAPVFFINSDEEIGSADSAARILRLARRARRVFVLEPALGPSGRLKTRRKGALRFNVQVRGRAAHAGLDPEKGASAVLELAHVIRELYALADPERGISVNVGVISGGTRRNVVAAEARAEVDVRVLRMADALEVERKVRDLSPATPGTSLEILGGMDRPPLEATPGNQALWRAAERCARELGFELGEGTAGGASDGSFTSQVAPTLDGLGAVGDGAHALHEHVVIDKMPERAALLAMLLLEPTAHI